MLRDEIESGFVKKGVPAELACHVLDQYENAKRRFYLGDHRPTVVDGGLFVEAALRLIDHALFGTYTPLGKSLPAFDTTTLQRYENAQLLDDSLRIMIPRVLFPIYALRG